MKINVFLHYLQQACFFYFCHAQKKGMRKVLVKTTL